DDDAEDDAIEPSDDAAVEARSARIDRHGMALPGVADRADAIVEQRLEQPAAIVARAADQEVFRSLAPIGLEPVDIGLEAAGGGDESGGANSDALAAASNCRRQEHAGVDLERDDFGIVSGLDAEPLGGEVEAVEHRPTAAEKKGVRPPQAQRAAKRGLEAHTLRRDPMQHVLGLADHVAGKLLVGVA